MAGAREHIGAGRNRAQDVLARLGHGRIQRQAQRQVRGNRRRQRAARAVPVVRGNALRLQDRKSTRLNSSHLVISYAVFCLKKKKTPCTRKPINATTASQPSYFRLISLPTMSAPDFHFSSRASPR